MCSKMNSEQPAGDSRTDHTHATGVDDIQESLDSGMNDHISKPINMEELIDTITKYIKHD